MLPPRRYSSKIFAVLSAFEIHSRFATILAHSEFEFDSLTLIKTDETSFLYFRDMNEHVFVRAIRSNKAVTLCRIKPLNCSTHVYSSFVTATIPKNGRTASSGKLLWRLAQPVAGSETHLEGMHSRNNTFPSLRTFAKRASF
jgi:hypothetical protein